MFSSKYIIKTIDKVKNNVKNKVNLITEPLLLTSILLLPIAMLYFNKKYYLLSLFLFLNGIASYFYHLEQINLMNKKKKTEINVFHKYDAILSVISFLLSVNLTRNVSKESRFILGLNVMFAFVFYCLNYYYQSYDYHLMWHTFVLIGQLYLVIKLKTKR